MKKVTLELTQNEVEIVKELVKGRVEANDNMKRIYNKALIDPDISNSEKSIAAVKQALKQIDNQQQQLLEVVAKLAVI